MKSSIVSIILLFFSLTGYSQSYSEYKNIDRKGQLYIYWGWNWSWYTKSNIHFQGTNFDYNLEKVAAKDRQTPFSADIYLNPGNATIPQYNFRLGYFINSKYNISLGIDHMKYVMVQDQTTKISGNIENTGSIYDGSYDNDDIILKEEFLVYEHTDGLNYANIEVRRFDEVYTWKKINISVTEGLGGGILYPKTRTVMFNGEEHDEFDLSGFGLSAMLGVNFTFFRYFFIQSEFKGGYINMPSVEISPSSAEKASQSFFFGQVNAVFGFNINLVKQKSKTPEPKD